MSSSYVVPKGVGGFVCTYAFEEHIYIILAGVDDSSSGDKDQVILKTCLPLERVTFLVSLFPPHCISNFTLPLSRICKFFFLFLTFPWRSSGCLIPPFLNCSQTTRFAQEHRERWENIKSGTSGVNTLKSHPERLIIRGNKRVAETSTSKLLEAKAKRMEEGALCFWPG